jgi:lipopolysaccharide transport system permease protein
MTEAATLSPGSIPPSDSSTDEQWTTVITAERGWFDLRLKELWRYKYLIWLFVWRDFVAVYKQTILGPLWYIIQPLFTTLTFTIIFGKVAKLPTDGIPQFLFYLSGTVIWGYFAMCLTKTSNTFVENAGIFGKVYFPRLVVPISVVISCLIHFTIQFMVFLGFLGFFYWRGAPVQPSYWVLLTPLLLICLAGLGLGFGIVVSSLTTKYRDLAHLVGFGTQLWMYATPVIYPLSVAPEKWRWLIALNPLAPVIEFFRFAFLGVSTLSPVYLLYTAGFMVVILLAGILLFNKVEATFMDTV